MLSSMLLRAQSLSKIDSLQHEIIQLQQQLGRVKPMLPVARGVMIPTESLNGAFTYTYANAIGVAGEPVQKGNSVTVNLAEPLQGQPTIIATFATDPYAPVPIVPQITYHQTSDRSVTFEFTAITIEGKPYPQITSEMSFVIFDAPKD
jgi:hypothetical protein